jgi:hypothetical protein
MHGSNQINQEPSCNFFLKKLLTINENKIEKIKRQIYIKIFNIAILVIYLVVFNEFGFKINL